MPGWLRRLRARIRYRHFEAELKDEIEVHRAMAENALASSGATSEEVRAGAAKTLGNVTLARETARRVWIAPWLEGLWQDASYAVRSLRKSPGYAITAIATLTITTGLTTNFFALTVGLLFRPWNVPEPDRVVVVYATRHYPRFTSEGLYPNSYQYLRANAQTADLAALVVDDATVGSQSDQAIRKVSGNYFQVLRLPIIAGRPLIDADDTPGRAARAVVISHATWMEQFGGMPALGAILRLNDIPFTVVGVAGHGATDFQWADVPKAWVPMLSLPERNSSNEPSVRVAGRLRDGVTFAEADAEFRTLSGRLPVTQDRTMTVATTVRLSGTTLLGHDRAEEMVRKLVLLSVAPLVVLLLGCANVGNLQLARGFSRRREIAVRLALGASRARVVRQLLVDGLVLCSAAALLSLVATYTVPRALFYWYEPLSSSSGFDFTPSWRVVAFSAVLACATAVVSGLMPALRATRIAPGPQYVGVDRSSLRSGLLAAQTGASLLLVLGAALLARGIQHATGDGLGFDPAVSVSRIDLPKGAYTPGQDRAFRRRVLAEAEKAGIRPIGTAQNAPYLGAWGTVASSTTGQRLDVTKNFVSPGYFDVLRIPLRAGRMFEPRADGTEAVVNELMASRLWPGQNPIGHTFTYEGNRRVVVGVVADARIHLPDSVDSEFFEPVDWPRDFIVRDEAARVRLAALVTRLESRATMRLTPMSPGIREHTQGSAVVATVVTWIAAVALFIATVGTFGVFSYLVGERTREIGVRMALGARTRDLVSILMMRLCAPLVTGLALGLLAAQPLGFVVRNQLFGLSLHDPLAYAGVIGVLSLSALAALFGPIRRALRVDPVVTLRHD